MKNKHIIATALAVAVLLFTTACSSAGPLFLKAVFYGALVVEKLQDRLAGTAAERNALCDYYTAHREEIEAVREYAKANWQQIPEQHKPALLAINEQLNACDNNVKARPTTARALLDAFKSAVSLYRTLKTSGVL
ncbi:MAG TPA: hypothetical protein VFN10_22625 [Thermoanaerobaculia bacterium]|nr:hypothetical protein [Thermoanaerobaculia bacterium]